MAASRPRVGRRNRRGAGTGVLSRSVRRLVTSGAFGMSKEEIFQRGYVRVVAPSDFSSPTYAAKTAPYERLPFITFVSLGRRRRIREGRQHSHAGRELERVGKSVLGVVEAGASAESVPVVSTGEAGSMGSPGAGSAPTISDRLRELAGLHAEGILDDAEFAAAKAKLLESL